MHFGSKRVASIGASLVAVLVFAAGCGRSTTTRVFEASAPITTVPPPPTTTSTTVPACPQPSVPAGAETTQLATPSAANLPYSATPGGPAVGHLVERWGGTSTRPVVDQQNGWVQVRLATRPNGSTGWVPLASVTLSTTSYRVVVSICQRSLTLFNGSLAVYTAPVGVGRPQWPTPVGPTYVDSVVATPKHQLYIYGPTVFILGLHSNVFTEFDGGDGTVALHGYPSDPGSTKGVMSSHGCVRAGPDTINAVRAVPVGTPVDVIA